MTRYMYVVINETDIQKLQDKISRFAGEGYFHCNSYGIPDHRGAIHIAVMGRAVPDEKASQ